MPCCYPGRRVLLALGAVCVLVSWMHTLRRFFLVPGLYAPAQVLGAKLITYRGPMGRFPEHLLLMCPSNVGVQVSLLRAAPSHVVSLGA